MRPGKFAKLKALTSAKPMQASIPPIGVDFGVGSLKVLQIESGSKPSLIAAAEIETPSEYRTDPSERMAFQLDALSGLIASGGFKGNRVALSIPVGQTLCKPLRVQKTPGISTNALVQGALAVQLGCDLNDIVYRFVEVCEVTGDKGAKTEVICFATARRLVDRMVRGCRSAKLEPVGIQNQFAADASAMKLVAQEADVDGNAMLCIDIGAGSTKVVISHKGKIVFAKNIDVGGGHFDEMVASQLGIGFEQAHDRRIEMDEFAGAGSSYRAEASVDEAPDEGSGFAILSAALRRDGVEASERTASTAQAAPSGEVDLSEPLEILTDEIGMSLRYHQSVFPDARISQALFVGGEASHTALSRHIAKVVRVPAKVVNPLAGVSRTGTEPTGGVDTGESLPGWSVALGLCLCPTDL
jgi:type IV pilus assembly protein PilM